MTRKQLNIVWKDILYEMNNLVTGPSNNNVNEQYTVYMMITYAYLIKQGSVPNTANVDIMYKPSFSYANKFNVWLNTANIRKYILDLHVCNDGNYDICSNYVEKLWKKHEEKGEVFNCEITKEEVLALLHSKKKDKELILGITDLFIKGDFKVLRFVVPKIELPKSAIIVSA